MFPWDSGSNTWMTPMQHCQPQECKSSWTTSMELNTAYSSRLRWSQRQAPISGHSAPARSRLVHLDHALCLEKPPTLIATWTSCLTIPWPTNLRWSRLCTGGSEQSAWMWRRRTRKPDTSDRPSSTTGFVGFSQRTGNLGILLLLHEVWLDITTGRRPTVGSTDTLLWHSTATNSIFPINGPKPLRWVYCYDTADHFHGCRGAFILELTWLPGMWSKPLLAFLFFSSNPCHHT